VGQRSQRLKRGRGQCASGLSLGGRGRWLARLLAQNERGVREERAECAYGPGAGRDRGVRKNGPAEHGWAEWKAGSRAGLRGARLQCWVWIWVSYWVSIFLFFFYFLSLFYF